MAINKRQAQRAFKKAKANGYEPGAHDEVDKAETAEEYTEKTKRDQDSALKHYVYWFEGQSIEADDDDSGYDSGEEDDDDDDEPVRLEAVDLNKAFCLQKGTSLPELATIKLFLRWKVSISHGVINKDKPTASSMNTFEEWLFAGFTRYTQTVVPEDYRKKVYRWTRKVLVKEEVVTNETKPKHLFGPKDGVRFLKTFWSADDAHFVHPRNRAQIPFLLSVFTWTGARIGAFFPNKDKPEAGLHYKDIELVLLRTPGGWKVAYKIDQRWVKNNKDPNFTTFGSSTAEVDGMIYSDVHYLISMAIQDKAIYGISTVEDFWDLNIPEGEDVLHLRWNDEVVNLPLLRNATMHKGVGTDSLPKATFERIWRSVLRLSGYFGYATIHAIRRFLCKVLDERYTVTQRSQHVTHVDPRVYGQSYLARTSACDGKNAYLGRKADHDHVDYFQSLEKFRQTGLPCNLPAREEAALEEDESLVRLKRKQKQLELTPTCSEKIKTAIRKVHNRRQLLKRHRLRQYQEDWVKKRRDWLVLTRGKVNPMDRRDDELVQALCKIFQERRRLMELLLSEDFMERREMKLAIQDLVTFLTRNYTVVYLPGEEPVDGLCPAAGCDKNVDKISVKSQRAAHIHTCRRKECARDQSLLQSDLRYCFDCFAWIQKDDHDDHFRQHLDILSSFRCGTITYCHTLVFPARCPFCLGEPGADAAHRMQTWTRDRDLVDHMEVKHLHQVQWPARCPHPCCDVDLPDESHFWFHLADDHKVRRSETRAKRCIEEDANENTTLKKRNVASADLRIIQYSGKDCLAELKPSVKSPQSMTFVNPLVSPFLTLVPPIPEAESSTPPQTQELSHSGSSTPLSTGLMNSTLGVTDPDFSKLSDVVRSLSESHGMLGEQETEEELFFKFIDYPEDGKDVQSLQNLRPVQGNGSATVLNKLAQHALELCQLSDGGSSSAFEPPPKLTIKLRLSASKKWTSPRLHPSGNTEETPTRKPKRGPKSRKTPVKKPDIRSSVKKSGGIVLRFIQPKSKPARSRKRSASRLK